MGIFKLNGVDYMGGSGGGGNSNEQSLSYAEYLALSEAEKTNDTNYYIYDINGDGQEFQPIIYSEEEREVGVWTDGKPLYQKTIIIDSVPSNNWDYYDIADNIDKVVDYRGNIFRSDGGAESIEYNRYDSGNETWYTCIVIQNDNKKFFMRSYTAKSGIAYITFQYTKTTNIPGSGTWTPQGIPAHHYSTSEQVIGTWIDGSTLYEKTITTTISSQTQWIDTGVNNTDNIISVEGFLQQSNTTTILPSSDPQAQVGINTINSSIVTTNKWSILYRTNSSALNNGTLYLTICYTKATS